MPAIMQNEPRKRGRGRPPKQHDEASDRNVPTSAGVISLGETYTRRELQKRLGIGAVALRAAEARGLRASQWGHLKLYRGADIDAFLKKEAEVPIRE